MKLKLSIIMLILNCWQQQILALYSGLDSLVRTKEVQRLLNTKSCPNCNLRDSHLLFEDLTYSDLRGADLSAADTISANFNYSNFTGAKLNAARMNLAMFNNAILDHISGDKTIFRNAIFNDASIQSAVLREASLNGAEIRQTNFTKSILTGLDMQNVKAAGAIFKDVHIEYAVGDNGDFDLANFSGAKAKRISLNKATLKEAILSNTDLTQASLQNTNFFKANMHGAILKNASCVGSTFINVDLTKTILDGADLSSADLYDAKITKDQLKNTLLCSTVMPTGEINDRDCIKVKELEKNVIKKITSRLPALPGSPKPGVGASPAKSAPFEVLDSTAPKKDVPASNAEPFKNMAGQGIRPTVTIPAGEFKPSGPIGGEAPKINADLNKAITSTDATPTTPKI